MLRKISGSEGESHADIFGKSASSTGNRQCKGPEAESHLQRARSRKVADWNRVGDGKGGGS